MTLYESLQSVKDPRRAQGQRTSKEQLFSMIIISNLCGHFGGRGISRFSKVHQEVMNEYLHLKHKIPSHVTFTDVLNRVDSKELIKAFNTWASYFVSLDKGAAVSGDGKALASTVKNAHKSSQDFEAVVSIFCQQSGLVRLVEQYRNAKKSEISIVRNLLGDLKDMGLTIHLDALHIKKND